MRLREPEIRTAVASLRYEGTAHSQSILSDTTFDFDDTVINSRAYRAVLARHQRGLDQQNSRSQRSGVRQGQADDTAPDVRIEGNNDPSSNLSNNTTTDLAILFQQSRRIYIREDGNWQERFLRVASPHERFQWDTFWNVSIPASLPSETDAMECEFYSLWWDLFQEIQISHLQKELLTQIFDYTIEAAIDHQAMRQPMREVQSNSSWPDISLRQKPQELFNLIQSVTEQTLLTPLRTQYQNTSDTARGTPAAFQVWAREVRPHYAMYLSQIVDHVHGALAVISLSLGHRSAAHAFVDRYFPRLNPTSDISNLKPDFELSRVFCQAWDGLYDAYSRGGENPVPDESRPFSTLGRYLASLRRIRNLCTRNDGLPFLHSMYLRELTDSIGALEHLQGHCIQVLGDSLKRVTDDEVYYFFVTEGLMPNKSGQGTLVDFARYVVNSYLEDSQAWGEILEKARLSDQWRAGLGVVARRTY